MHFLWWGEFGPNKQVTLKKFFHEPKKYFHHFSHVPIILLTDSTNPHAQLRKILERS
jgi:hypothetical protein